MFPVPRRLDNGNLFVPVAGYDGRLDLYFDGMIEIGPEHPEYEAYLAQIEGSEG